MNSTFSNERQAALYDLWRQDTDFYPETQKWRSTLNTSEKEVVERWEYLHSCWSEETNDPETEEWREELTEHEERLVDAWDCQYNYDVETICKQIMAAQEKNKQGVAAKLEAAKQQVAERAAAAPPMEHTQSRSSGHSR